MERTRTDESWKSGFAQLGPALLLFARRWANCRADAEDIVQEAFVRFWRKQHSLENRALLYATVRSAALDRLRRDQRRARREASVAREHPEFFESFALEDESQELLALAVEQLPNEQREVVILKIWNELTFAEIAQVLEISQNTAASRYRYALEALKKNLQPHE